MSISLSGTRKRIFNDFLYQISYFKLYYTKPAISIFKTQNSHETDKMSFRECLSEGGDIFLKSDRKKRGRREHGRSRQALHDKDVA